MLNILYLLTRQVVTWQIVSETKKQIELQKISNIFSLKTNAAKILRMTEAYLLFCRAEQRKGFSPVQQTNERQQK